MINSFAIRYRDYRGVRHVHAREAVLLACLARNRWASCRIPVVSNPKGKRVEVRFPDPRSNPYLAFAAMLMAGLDGVQNKIHPGDPIDKNLYDLPPEELRKVPTVCGSPREALNELDKDRAFLKKGDVFTDDMIDSYMDLEWDQTRTRTEEHGPARIPLGLVRVGPCTSVFVRVSPRPASPA